MEEKLKFRYPSVTADSGYESEEGYSYLRERKQKPCIKPQTYEKLKKRSFKKDISKRENMKYEEETDTYTLHAGKKLKPKETSVYTFQRFLLRDRTKVKLEILLLCMGYNLNKLHAKIQYERTGSHLFSLKESA